MTGFVDTSALMALLDAGDPRHDATLAAWDSIAEKADLLTSNYVAVESFALAQRRIGIGALRTLSADILSAMEIVFVTPDEHAAALATVLAANRRRLSYVDCSSFEVMRRRGVRNALALDRDFARQGFQVLPAATG